MAKPRLTRISTGITAGIETGIVKSPQNPYDLKAERGLAKSDVKHRLSVSYVYELPFGRGHSWGQNWPRAVDVFFGAWQISGIHVIQGGLGLTPTLSGSAVLNLGGERQARPNLIGNPNLPKSERSVQRWFNTDSAAHLRPRRARNRAAKATASRFVSPCWSGNAGKQTERFGIRLTAHLPLAFDWPSSRCSQKNDPWRTSRDWRLN